MKILLEKILQSYTDWIQGPQDLIGEKKPSALFYFLAPVLRRLMCGSADTIVTKRSMRLRRIIHPLLIRLAPLFLERKQVIDSRSDKMPDRPVIWCANHGFKDDISASVIAAKRPAYILFGSLPALYNTFDGISAYLNGIVICNRKVKSSRTKSKKAALKVLENGCDLVIFPEGVWNKTPEKLLLNFWPGVYKLAKETGSMVVPVIHYLEDPLVKKKGNVIHTVIADPVSMDGLSEREGLTLLRDTMATWYYRLMECYGKTTREALLDGKTADEAWERFQSLHTSRIRYYDREIELKADYRPRDIIRSEDVRRPVTYIKGDSPESLEYLRYAYRIVAQEESRDVQRRY